MFQQNITLEFLHLFLTRVVDFHATFCQIQQTIETMANYFPKVYVFYHVVKCKEGIFLLETAVFRKNCTKFGPIL
jgi:hypothetical protein